MRGPRGLLLPGSGLEHPDRLAVLGLRVVAPEAAHPLLVRLGGFEATPRSVLEDAATRAAVAASYDAADEAGYDDDRPERVADAVLGLVAALNAEPGEYPYLADLALPGDDGDWYPAGELLLPGSPLAEVLAADAPFGTVDQAAARPLRRPGAGGGGRAVLVRPADGGRRRARRVRPSTWTWTASRTGRPTPRRRQLGDDLTFRRSRSS